MKNMLTIAALLTLVVVAAISFGPSFVSADEYGAQSWSDKKTEEMPMGQHSMGVTIDSIDHKTGFMKVKSGMGEMILHYPPPAIKDLKKGDKISVNLSFTKEEGKKDDGMMKMK